MREEREQDLEVEAEGGDAAEEHEAPQHERRAHRVPEALAQALEHRRVLFGLLMAPDLARIHPQQADQHGDVGDAC